MRAFLLIKKLSFTSYATMALLNKLPLQMALSKKGQCHSLRIDNNSHVTKFHLNQSIFKATLIRKTGTAQHPYPMLKRKRECPRFARALTKQKKIGIRIQDRFISSPTWNAQREKRSPKRSPTVPDNDTRCHCFKKCPLSAIFIPWPSINQIEKQN